MAKLVIIQNVPQILISIQLKLTGDDVFLAQDMAK